MSLPEPTPTFLFDWQSAELAAVEHMKSLGFIDAHTTQSGADGGIDVESSEAAAQVKFYANPVGRPDIQRLRGAAHEYKISLFYSTGGYTNEAVQYANDAGVALFLMSPYGHADAFSQFAEVLADPALVEERRTRLNELRAIRYEFASASFEEALTLYEKFGRLIPLSDEEGLYYTHLFAELTDSAQAFKRAVQEYKFEAADSIFDDIQKRVSFLVWITSSTVRPPYKNLEQAIVEGWELADEAISDLSLYRAATGVFKLIELSVDSLKPWDRIFDDGVSASQLDDSELKQAARMLFELSSDRNLLTPELTDRLKRSVSEGLQRVHLKAGMLFKQTSDAVRRLNLDPPREILGTQLRVDALAARIHRQLGAS